MEEHTGREIAGLLRELYVDRRWTDREISGYLQSSHGLDVSRTAINQWRDEFGINRTARVTAIDEASA